jgi:dTDP-4-amino-4,6-dideoxygalactose transaminase
MNRKILVSDLKRHTAQLRDELIAAATSVVDSGWFVHGNACTGFEREFAEFCGAKHGIGVANGTDALELALRALDVRPGSRVATVANAGFYTSTATLAIGAVPVYVDVNAETHLMDLDRLSRLVDSDPVDVVVITHLYGLMHDMDAVRKICDPKGIKVLEDCAQAHGARRRGRRAGSIGDAATFSFYPTKNLGAIGDGGMVTTNSDDVAHRVRTLRQYGWESKYRVGTPGGRNSRLDEMQAAVLSVKLRHLDEWNARRRAIAVHYSEDIRNPEVVLPPARGEEYVGHLYVVQTDDRAKLQARLGEAGIATDVHYPVPDHLQPVHSNALSGALLDVTENLAGRILSLPIYPELTDEEVDYIIGVVNSR